MDQYGTAIELVNKPEAGFRDIELHDSYAEADEVAEFMNARLPKNVKSVVVRICRV